MKDYSEKRDFQRMQIDAEIELSDAQGEVFRGTCRDLSASGMQILVQRPVAVGEELTTVLHSSDPQIPPLEMVCEVLRCQQEEDGYLLGTAINEVS